MYLYKMKEIFTHKITQLMKKIALFGLIIAAAFSFASCGQNSKKEIDLRLMCYNVRNCKGLDNVYSPERIAKIINDGNVEAVALQELDSMSKRNPVDVLGELAKLTGMYPSYGPSIDFQGGKYGIGMLTKEKPLSFYRIPLPCRSEPRSLLLVEMEDYYYCCTHLSLHNDDRVEAVKIIVNEVAKLNKPVVVAGDFNAYRTEEPMKIMAEHFDVFKKTGMLVNTIPADNPDSEIDFICLYTDKGATAEVKEHIVIDAQGSDHLAMIAEFKINQ